MLDLKNEGKSSRFIASFLGTQYQLEISYSSIERHLNHLSEPQPSKIREMPVYDDLHLQMTYLLEDGLALFTRHVQSQLDNKGGVTTSLEIFRSLDLLYNVFAKLYPQGNAAQASSRIETSEQLTEKMMDHLVLEGKTEKEAADFVLDMGRLLHLIQDNAHV